MLCSFLRLADIPCQYNLVVTETLFERAMRERVDEGVRGFSLAPIFHFSAHGNEHGIQLTSQYDDCSIMPWSRLKALLHHWHSLDLSLGGTGLGVCMSSCEGLHARRMAQVDSAGEIPMGWMLGSASKPHYADAALAFAVFYRRYWEGADEAALIAAIRSASGIPDFSFVAGHVEQRNHAQVATFRKGFREYLAKRFRDDPGSIPGGGA